MKKHILMLSVLTGLFMLSSCKPTISGKDEASFKASKMKVEEGLSPAEKTDLEKALRVVVLKAMKEKFNNPAENKGKSFDESFSGIVSYAEDFLKKDNEEKKQQIKTEIDSLSKQKIEFQKKVSEIDRFKLKEIEITQDEFFDEMVPFLGYTFINTSDKDIIGDYMFHIDIFSKSTGKLITSQEQGGGFKDGFAIKPNETEDFNDPLLEDAKKHSETLWKTAKYPIKDFAPFDLVIKVYPIKITTKAGTIERPKDPLFDRQIADLNKQLKELDGVKGTLDELELTK
jgi:hypothetical protein